MQVKPSKEHIGRRVNYVGKLATVVGHDKDGDYVIQFDDRSDGNICGEEDLSRISAGAIVGESGYMWVMGYNTYTLLDEEAIQKGLDKQYGTVDDDDILEGITRHYINLDKLSKEQLMEIIKILSR